MTEQVVEALHEVVGAIGGQPRSGQERMAAAVADAMQRQRHLVVQAGTGTGKSFGYLVPAVLRAAEHDERVLISTATLALQRQLISTDIPTVLGALEDRLSRRLSVAVIKGRGNYLCRLRLSESAADEPDPAGLFEIPGRLTAQGTAVRQWAERTETGDRDDLPEPVDGRVWRALSVSGRECIGRAKCPVGEQCFAESAREAAAAADVVVANHTLLAIDLATESEVLPEYDAAVIDEAHELTDRLTQASTEVLTMSGLAEAGRRATGLLSADASQRWQEAAEAFGDAMHRTLASQSGPDTRIQQTPEELVRALARLRDAAHEGLTQLAGLSGEDSVSRQQAAVAALTEAHDRAGLLLREDDGLVRWGSEEPLGMAAAPLRVGHLLRDGLLTEGVVVATSATLRIGGSFTELASAWGLAGPPADLDADEQAAAPASASWASTDVGSPFDYPRQAMLYVPRDLPAPGRAPMSDLALSRIAALIRAAGGRTLVLASSWRAVDTISEHLRDAAIPDVPLLVQERGSPAGPLVANFAAEERSVLVGTRSLWQGVDVPGPSCRCVIIDKIPFPRPDDPLLAARSDAAAAAGSSGFAAVSLPHAGLLLAQGAGRLIRRDDDRGVVAILDPRLLQRGYGRYLLDSLPAMWRTSDTDVVLAGLKRLSAASDAT